MTPDEVLVIRLFERVEVVEVLDELPRWDARGHGFLLVDAKNMAEVGTKTITLTSRREAALEAAHGPLKTLLVHAFDARPGAATRIGRKEGKNDIVLPDQRVSSSHLLVEAGPDGALFLTDLGSTNGTFVDGHKVAPGADARVRLSPGAAVVLGMLPVHIVHHDELVAIVQERRRAWAQEGARVDAPAPTGSPRR
jgi:hypothetical protein